MKKRVMMSLCVVAALLGAAGLAGAVPRPQSGGTLLQAGAPTLVSYQGQVSLDGRPFDGTGYFKFAIVDAGGSTTYWSNDGSSGAGEEPETPIELTVTGGLFNVLLGDPSVEGMDEPLVADVFAEPEECYLRVWFSEGGETFQLLSPDRRIASVPYALQAEVAAYAVQADEAGNANTLGGRLPGNTSGRIPINNGALNSNLNADLLDGQHASDLEVPSGAVVLGFRDDAGLTGAGYIHLGPGTVELWRSTSTTSAPSGRNMHTAVWTGSEMLVWGGSGSSPYLNDGGRYDPSTDTWTLITATDAPSARWAHTAVWTGSEMLVWGGYGGSYFNDGRRYDPASDTWSVVSTTNAPSGRYYHTAVWSGSEMIVWGGYDSSFLDTGGRYDPATHTWTPTSTSSAPSGRSDHTAVWTGSQMLVWGGNGASGTENTGRSYDPSTDTWTYMDPSGAPEARQDHTAVWTGSEMTVWGGEIEGWLTNSGGRYNPATDAWTDVTTADVPGYRTLHTAVWTGSEMIVWGGYNTRDHVNSGGRYSRLHLYQKP